MKSSNQFLILVLLMLIVQTSVAQEKRTYRDIAFEYLMQNVESISARPWRVKSDSYNKMPNGDYIVKMTLARTLTQEEDALVANQVQAYGATFNVGVRQGKKYTNYEDTRSYLVFVDRFGEAGGYLAEPSYYKLHYLNGNVWIFLNGRGKEVDGYKLSNYDKILCYSSKGTLVEEKNDLVLYSVADTPNYLYLVGVINTTEGTRSIVRTINRKTNVSKDKLGELGEIDYSLEFIDKGVSIAKHKNNGNPIRYIIPYEPEDENFQIQKVMEGHDLTTPSGQVLLGERYLKGDVLKKNEKKAFELFEKAANKNDEKGLYKLAECYLNGWGVAQNGSSAVTYFEKCINLGNTDAMIALSDMYAEGNGIEKNMSKALYWKEKLAFNGNLDARKYVLANQSIEYEKVNITADDAYKKGRDSHKEKSYDWAKFCFERAINLGSKDAMLFYGEWLYFGEGVTRDCDRAIELLSKLGEEDNNRYAQKMLALIYRENKDVAPDVKKEMYWTSKAADNGDVDSQVRLGTAYLNGTGVKKDKKQSAEWYEKAAMQNHQDATRFTIVNYMNGNGVKKDMEKATYFLTHLDNQSQLEFADNVFNGVGMKKNQKLAASMYEKMALNGNMKATKKLALCYLEGTGVSKDIETAYQLAMKVRNTTHDGQDGDIYYIEGKYQETKISRNRAIVGTVIESYNRAIKCGNTQAIKALAAVKSKYGIR